jgi:hypothetical protein
LAVASRSSRLWESRVVWVMVWMTAAMDMSPPNEGGLTGEKEGPVAKGGEILAGGADAGDPASKGGEGLAGGADTPM